MSNVHPSGRPDPMTIGANHFALRNLPLGLRDALGVADVQRLAGSDMVELQRHGVGAIATIYASALQLVAIQPVANAGRALIRLPINGLPMSRLRKSRLPPRFHLLWRKLATWASPFTALIRTEFRRALGRKRARAMAANERTGGGSIPRRHEGLVPSVAYPCKPDIFAATYELVEGE